MFRLAKHTFLDVRAETLIGRVKENTLNNPPCHITPPSHHYLYVIHLINGLQCFYCNKISLVIIIAKSDVKQYSTTMQ